MADLLKTLAVPGVAPQGQLGHTLPILCAGLSQKPHQTSVLIRCLGGT
jgi:hypothetical protein